MVPVALKNKKQIIDAIGWCCDNIGPVNDPFLSFKRIGYPTPIALKEAFKQESEHKWTVDVDDFTFYFICKENAFVFTLVF
jgi:hypothetical protein